MIKKVIAVTVAAVLAAPVLPERVCAEDTPFDAAEISVQEETAPILSWGVGKEGSLDGWDLTDVRKLVTDNTYMNRQTASILIICFITKQIEKLRLQHCYDKVKCRVRIGHILLVRCDFNTFLMPNRIPIIPLINKLQTKKCTKKSIIKSLSLI